MFSKRATAVLALVAFVGGLLLSLAVRPGGGSSMRGAGPSRTPAEGSAPIAERAEGEAPARVRWRVPLSAPRTLPGSGETPIWLADALAAASRGAVTLQLYDPGEVVPAFSITDAVRDRKVQAGFTWLGYDQGKIPASPLFGATPFGLDPWAYIGWWHFGGGKELAEGIYAKHDHPPAYKLSKRVM